MTSKSVPATIFVAGAKIEAKLSVEEGYLSIRHARKRILVPVAKIREVLD